LSSRCESIATESSFVQHPASLYQSLPRRVSWSSHTEAKEIDYYSIDIPRRNTSGPLKRISLAESVQELAMLLEKDDLFREERNQVVPTAL
jgi:hypothetical protein